MLMASQLPGIQLPQEEVFVSSGSNIVLKVILDQTNNPEVIWKRCKNNSFTELDTTDPKYHKCSCHENPNTFELTIYNIDSSDEGEYMVDVILSSGTLESKSITVYVYEDDKNNTTGREELNLLRYKECASIARDALQLTLVRSLQQNKTDFANHLKNFKHKLTTKKSTPKLLPKEEEDLYPRDGSHVSLEKLDISILYKLLRNTTNIQRPKNNWNKVPPLESTGEGDDVERIHRYRNFLSHEQSMKKLSDEEFEEKWFDLTMAIDRLGKGKLRKPLCQLRNKRFEQSKLPKPTEKHNDPQSDMIREWQSHDKLFCGDIRCVEKAFKVIKDQNMVVIIGGSGSGKTATARHCALKLVNKNTKVMPIYNIREIHSAGGKHACVFVFDDPVGKMGLDDRKCEYLEENRNDVLQFFSQSKHKLIVTCRKIVYKEAKDYHVFDNYRVVDIEDKDYALSKDEKMKLLQVYGIEHLVDSSSLEEATFMFPLLCYILYGMKDQSSESESPQKALNAREFLLQELDAMARLEKTRIQYASLVLLVIAKNNFTDDVFHDKDLLKDIFDKCEVPGKPPSGTQILKTLAHLENTYVVQSQFGFKFLHDSFFEIVAFHFGREKENQILILRYLDVEYIANNTYIESRDYSGRDLQIKINHGNYKLLCRRLCLCLRELIELKQSSTSANLIFTHNCWSDEVFLENIFCKKDLVELFSKPYRWSKARAEEKTTHCSQKENLLENHEYGSFAVSSDGKFRLIDWIVRKGHLPFLTKFISKSSGWIDWIFRSPVIHPERLFRQSIYSKDKQMLMYALSAMKMKVEKYINKTFDSLQSIKQTPLTLACSLNAFEIVKILVEKGASVSMCNSNGESPLFLAVKNSSENVIHFLLEKRPLINDKNEKFSLFKVASERESVKIFKFLLQNCDHKSSAIDGQTPLHLAIKYGFNDVAEKLIDDGADVNAIDDKKQTPLHIACEKGNGKIVERLDTICDKSIKDDEERFPLHIACKYGKLKIVKFLYDEQYLGIRDKYGYTPEKYAKQCDDEKVFKYIRRKRN